MKSLTSFSLLVFCTVLLSATQLFAQDQDLTIYDEALNSPWINNSWSANVTFNSTEQAYSGTNAIKIAISSNWGALSLHHGNWGSAGIDPNPYQSLDFAIYATGASTFYIFFNNDQGQSFPSVSQAVAAGNWTVVSIPMSQLNPNGQTIQRLSIQKSTVGTFYVDDFRLTSSPAGSLPPAPSLALPADDATFSSATTTITFVWRPSEGAASYTLLVSPESPGPVIHQTEIADTSYTVEGLQPGRGYGWQVSATNSAGTSDWSTAWQFYIMQPIPVPPTLYSPANGATNVSTSPTLSWNGTPYTESVHGQISTDSLFSTIVQENPDLGHPPYSSQWSVTGLANNTTYYWRIAARNESGTSDWSEVWSFTTESSSPPPSEGWVAQSSGTTSALYAVSFVDQNIGTVVGENGTILRTTDGGTTWVTQQSGTSVNLNSVSFTDSNTGTIVGGNYFGSPGVILRTTNGGATWVEQSTEYGGSFLFGVSFADSNNGIAVGGDGVQRTTDGGTTWQFVPLGTELWGVDLTDANTGFVVAGGPLGYIYRTSDGGANWQYIDSVYMGTASTYSAVSFSNTSNGFIVSIDGTIVRTTDGGESFTFNKDVTSRVLSSVSSPTSSHAFAVGDGGSIFRTTDGGITWVKLVSGTSVQLRGVSFVNANTGIAVGENGTILKTIDSGGTVPLQAPKLISPEHESIGVSTSPTFTWNASAEATSYRLQVSEGYGFNTIVVDQQNIIDTSYTLNVVLAANSGHAWRVMASNNAETSDWSAHWRFITTQEPPPAPALISPTNGATGASTSLTFTWNATPGTFDYSVQVSSDSLFTSYVVNNTTAGQTSYSVNGLSAGTIYFWRVNAQNGSGSGDWSTVWNFTTEAPPPPPNNPDLIVYEDALQSPWINASWSSAVTYGSTEQTYDSSASSIKVVANSWGALSLHHGSWGSQGLDPAQYQSVDFAVYSTNSTSFYVRLGNDQGNSFPSVGNNIEPNNWVVLSIPMSQLNPNGLVFHRLSIQKSTSGTFYADELRFTGAPQPSASSDALAMGSEERAVEIPTEFGLSQNYPNPFNPTTNIRFQLPVDSWADLRVYNILGQEVATLIEGNQQAGYHTVRFEAQYLPSGFYIYRLQARDAEGKIFTQSHRMILLK